ncbi:UNVERIFIED_CONTAM: Protein CASP [Trichonephila clavipes]
MLKVSDYVRNQLPPIEIIIGVPFLASCFPLCLRWFVMDSSLPSEKTEEKDPELLHLFDEKENDQLGSEFAIKSNLEEAETKVAQLQSALDRSQSELFDLKSRYDEDSNAKSDEMEIIVNDLERANQYSYNAGF